MLLVLPLAGCLYEANASARAEARFPPPGRLIDIGARRLHLLCIGSGRPIVLFEASGLSNSASSQAARSSLTRHTTVCSYDRAGVGWSDRGPDPVSVGGLAEDLRQLQDRAGLESPLVVVTSSMGGVVTEMFARRYPERVAGLVFVDAGNSELLKMAGPRVDGWLMSEAAVACRAVSAAGLVGLMRIADPFGFGRQHSEDGDRSAAAMYGAQPWRAVCAAMRGSGQSLEEFAHTPPLRGDVPLIALSAERPNDMAGPFDALIPSGTQRELVRSLYPLLKESAQRLARQSPKGSWRLVRNTGHLIASDQPQAVVDATLDVMAQVRGNRVP